MLPDSYGFSAATRARRWSERMQEAMDKALAELWPKRSGDCPVATPEQAVILASIVEKETGKPPSGRWSRAFIATA